MPSVWVVISWNCSGDVSLISAHSTEESALMDKEKQLNPEYCVVEKVIYGSIEPLENI